MGRTKKYMSDTIPKPLIESNNSNNIIDNNIIDINIIDINSFKKKEKMLYDVLNDFFYKCSEDEIKTIIGIINGKYKISLRFLDWFVTRYCYLYKTSIQINNNYNKEEDFNINISYKAQLKSHKKKCFDPFKRKNKFYYSFKKNNFNYSILTTLGQLNFFKWALSYNIIDYVEKNFNTINNKINYVNSFFKKNIIDNNTLSLVSSDELKSKLSNSQDNLSDSNINNNSDSNDLSNSKDNLSNSSIDNNLKYSSKKKIQSYNPIVSRKILVEL